VTAAADLRERAYPHYCRRYALSGK